MSTLFVSRLPDGKYVGVTSEDVIQREFEDGALGDLQEGEEIPDNATYIESRTICIKDEPNHNCSCHWMQNCTCRIREYKKLYIYEVLQKESENERT